MRLWRWATGGGALSHLPGQLWEERQANPSRSAKRSFHLERKGLVASAHIMGAGLAVMIELAHLLTSLQPAGLALGVAITTGMGALIALAAHGVPSSALGALVVAGMLAVALLRRGG
jgi:hypothetical protein